MTNALFGHIGKTRWAAVRMMFARQDAQRAKARAQSEEPGFNAALKRKAEGRMAQMDAWPKDMRELANEIGFGVVYAFRYNGIKKANTIKHLFYLCRGQQIDGRPAEIGNHRPGFDP